MSELHVVKTTDGWALKDGDRVSSVHRTQVEAVEIARITVRKAGGGEVVVHRADGRFKERDSYGPDPRGRGERRRAARGDGPRTTLRLTRSLVEAADRLASELSISRNDALLRLATRGAQLYEREQRVAELRDARWEAVLAAIGSEDESFPSPADAHDAIVAARDDLGGI